ncbi:MAG: hypothetical protein QM628_00390 [Propionicimonas sp.]
MSNATALTPEYLAEIRALADAATPGDWTVDAPTRGLITIETGRAEVIAPDSVHCMAYCYGGSSSYTLSAADAAFIAVSRTAVPKLLDEIELLHYLLSESQTDLDNERESRDADDQIADVIREEWQIARAERDALAAKVARVEEAMARLEADERESLIRVGQHLHVSADVLVNIIRAALAGGGQ